MDAPPELLSIQELCGRFGVAQITLWRWRRRGWLPAHKIGRRVFFTADDVAELLRRKSADRALCRYREGPYWIAARADGQRAVETIRERPEDSLEAAGRLHLELATPPVVTIYLLPSGTTLNP